ncbi:MAG: CHASE3 domain-containing protein, partial [Rubrivivax sp.]|nr:CHASE3 domain-containing protein [Rubrivivax sp.]
MLATLTLLAGLVAWAVLSQDALDGDRSRAEAAERALTRLASLAAVSADAEAAQRGHALSGDAALLEALRQAPARQAALLDELRSLSSADAAQYARVLALAPLLARRGEQLAAAADLRQRGGAAGSAAAQAAVDPRGLQEQIQRALAGLQAEAEAGAAAAREQAASAGTWATRATLLAGMLALLLTGAALLHGQVLAARLASLRGEARARHDGDARLKQAHARLLESSLAPICFIDREGRVRRANPAAEALAGPGANLVGQPLVDGVLPEDRRRTER